MTLPPLLLGALICLVLAQVIGLTGLRLRLEVTASLAVLVLLAAALTLGVLGSLRFLPGHR